MNNKVFYKYYQMCSTAEQRKILNYIVIHQSNHAFEAQPHASWVSHLQMSKNHCYHFANRTLHCWANFLLSSLACQGYWCRHDITSTSWSNKGFFHLKCLRQQVCNDGGKTPLSLSLIAICKFSISCVWGNELAIIVRKLLYYFYLLVVIFHVVCDATWVHDLGGRTPLYNSSTCGLLCVMCEAIGSWSWWENSIIMVSTLVILCCVVCEVKNLLLAILVGSLLSCLFLFLWFIICCCVVYEVKNTWTWWEVLYELLLSFSPLCARC